ncbi:hypothetical protein D3C78_1185780 [compost metagenome]
MPESVLPLPTLPARSAMPVLAREMTLLASCTLIDGVKVAVQVMPPSLLVSPLRLPFGTDRSARVKPVTASLKVMVTVVVSPTVSVVSAITMAAVGRWLSMA